MSRILYQYGWAVLMLAIGIYIALVYVKNIHAFSGNSEKKKTLLTVIGMLLLLEIPWLVMSVLIFSGLSINIFSFVFLSAMNIYSYLWWGLTLFVILVFSGWVFLKKGAEALVEAHVFEETFSVTTAKLLVVGMFIGFFSIVAMLNILNLTGNLEIEIFI